jgi:hypothetical protein
MTSGLLVWFLIGVGAFMIQTPSEFLLKRSCHKEDRSAVFAAHFALTHACWLLAYPLTGVVGAQLGLSMAFFVAAAITAIGLVTAVGIWPACDSDIPVKNNNNSGFVRI